MPPYIYESHELLRLRPCLSGEESIISDSKDEETHGQRAAAIPLATPRLRALRRVRAASRGATLLRMIILLGIFNLL
jgi:hypothetical protein